MMLVMVKLESNRSAGTHSVPGLRLGLAASFGILLPKTKTIVDYLFEVFVV